MKKGLILLITFIIIIFIIGSIIFWPKKTICGNEICEPKENCLSCPRDCQCKEGEYCSEEKRSCVLPECGNDICEYFETPEACCLDCECFGKDEVCDPKENKCKKVEVKITDEEALRLVKDYYQAQAKNITSLEVVEPAVHEGKIGKEVMVNIEGQDWFDLVFVSEDGTIIEIKEP